jgi:hypothetical protein
MAAQAGLRAAGATGEGEDLEQGSPVAMGIRHQYHA